MKSLQNLTDFKSDFLKSVLVLHTLQLAQIGKVFFIDPNLIERESPNCPQSPMVSENKTSWKEVS